MDFTGSYWSDIGTPASYTAAVLDTLRMIGETVYCSSSARVGEIDVDGYAVIEQGGSVRGGSRLRNCIVMPGAEVTGSHENCIIGPGYDIPLTELEMQPSLHAAMRKDIGLAGPLFSWFDAPGRGQGRHREGGPHRCWRFRPPLFPHAERRHDGGHDGVQARRSRL